MYFQRYIARAAAGKVTIEAGAKDELRGQTYNYKQKYFDREDGAAQWQTTSITVAELQALKAAKQAEIAQINRLLADIAAIPIPVEA